MRKVLIGTGMLVLSLVLNVGSAKAAGTTSCKMTKATPAGTGPYTISAEGTISLSDTEKGFAGVQYQVLELEGGKQTYVGFTSLPDGPPTPGGAAKKVTGSSPPFPRPGKYRVFFSMQYMDKDMKLTTISASTDVTVK